MDTTEQAAQDQEALDARVTRLRALAGRIADTVEALPPPETWLEATRSARSIGLAARIIRRFPDKAADETPQRTSREQPIHVRLPIRERLRQSADRLLDAAERLPLPDSHLEGERAARFTLAAERMLEQLYAPPAAPKAAKTGPQAKLDPVFASWDDYNAWQSRRARTDAEFLALSVYKKDRYNRFRAKTLGHRHDYQRWDPAFPNRECEYNRYRVEGFNPEAALHPHDRTETWQLEAMKGPWPDPPS